MKFKTSLKGRLDAEINSVNSEWSKDDKKDPEIRILHGVALGDKFPTYEIKSPWLQQSEDHKTTKDP